VTERSSVDVCLNTEPGSYMKQTLAGALGGECSFHGERGRCDFAVWELISGLRVLSDSWGL
jgi:hypothetical protein